jgi:hypothetical protein
MSTGTRVVTIVATVGAAMGLVVAGSGVATAAPSASFSPAVADPGAEVTLTVQCAPSLSSGTVSPANAADDPLQLISSDWRLGVQTFKNVYRVEADAPAGPATYTSTCSNNEKAQATITIGGTPGPLPPIPTTTTNPTTTTTKTHATKSKKATRHVSKKPRGGIQTGGGPVATGSTN